MVEAGDEINYNLGAAGSDYWTVDTSKSYFPFLAFTVSGSADRLSEYTLDLLLDRLSQFTLAPSTVTNSKVHIGTNGVSLVAGLMFDEIILNYTLTSALDTVTGLPVDTEILQYVIGGSSPKVPGGFTEGISYTAFFAPPIGVPESSTLAIFAIGMIGLASRRFKKQS